MSFESLPSSPRYACDHIENQRAVLTSQATPVQSRNKASARSQASAPVFQRPSSEAATPSATDAKPSVYGLPRRSASSFVILSSIAVRSWFSPPEEDEYPASTARARATRFGSPASSARSRQRDWK